MKDVAVVLMASLVAFSISELKIGYLRYSRYQHIVWLMFGLIGATWHLARKEREHYENQARDAAPEATGTEDTRAA